MYGSLERKVIFDCFEVLYDKSGFLLTWVAFEHCWVPSYRQTQSGLIQVLFPLFDFRDIMTVIYFAVIEKLESTRL